MRFLIVIHILLVQFSLTAQNYNGCAQNSPIHVVVLGSSTAAGTGPSSSDSAWVNRYRRHLQALNPQNVVTNLGVGGTTTYNIMPDWFSATNRPSRNTTKNISEAIRLGADAVIINMPSNDASNGIGATEQLRNFRTIKNLADSFNLLLWVCTTQPKNFNSATKKQIQIDVKDSIILQYGNYAIDFWNGIADSTNGIKSIYDSGDGTHLNDLAHRELNQRVINEFLPNQLSDTLNYPDFTIRLETKINLCGDSAEKVSAIVSNLGPTFLSAVSVNFEIVTGQQSTTTALLLQGGMNGCESDTVLFNLNSFIGGNYSVRAYLDAIDTISTNDTTNFVNLIRVGHPTLAASDVYYCPNDSALLSAVAGNGTIVWYDSAASLSPIHIGSTYSILPIARQTDLFVEAVRGPLHFKKTLNLSRNANVNWNGFMFDIITNDTITLDSLALPINSMGNQKIIAYYRYGSHKRVENTMLKWTYWGIDSSTITAAGEFANLNYSDLQLSPNDTFAVYLHLQNSNATLSYQSASSATASSDLKLTVPSGSGISNTFGTIYYPRNFGGIINYHHGFNPQGDCQSPREKVSLTESQPYLRLGKDTIIYGNDSLLLNQNGFSNHVWSNGDSTAQLTVSNSTFGLGNHRVILEAMDSLGCLNRDTIRIVIALAVGLNKNHVTSIGVSPNPSTGIIKLSGLKNTTAGIEVFSIRGKSVYRDNAVREYLNLNHLPKGFYHLVVKQGELMKVKKIILN
jgi:hypothetical protein